MTEAMKTYAALDKQIKKLEAEKELIRKKVIREFKDNPDEDFKGMTCTESSKITFFKDAFFEWVAKEFPDQVDNCTAKYIDEEKFETLYSAGKIKYDSLPPEIYKSQPVTTIRITKVK